MNKYKGKYIAPKTKLEIELHSEGGISVKAIAKLLGEKVNTVLVNLRNHGVLRRSAGRDIEELVAQWLEKQGKIVVRQRGDAPFDLLVDGKRIDVKSSHAHINDKSRPNYLMYQFVIFHRQRKFAKDYQKELDLFYLVFLNEEGRPIYALAPKFIKRKHAITVRYPNINKSFTFIGNLDGESAGEYENEQQI